MFRLIISVVLITKCLCINKIEQPGAMGPDVVTTVVDIIRSNCILSHDKLFLRRLAYIETRDGSLPNAYGNPNFDGGIWQVTQAMLTETQGNQAILKPIYQKIKNKLHIDWLSVTWKDLRKPLYSGLAAALYLTLHTQQSSQEIPLKVEEQATFWKNTYHIGGQAYNFTSVIQALELGCKVSNREVDLAFIVDSSSSLSQDDFTRMKYFLGDVVKGLNVGPSATKVSVVVYASTATVQFNLGQHLTNAAVDTAINNLKYTGGSTNTAEALNITLTDVFRKSGRSNAVKVIVLITDGRSDDRINTDHSAQLIHNNNIAVFTVGIGNSIDHGELERVATPPACTHTFSVKSFDAVANLVQEIQTSICRAPLYVNHTVTCEVGKCPPYGFPFTGSHGLSIEANVSCGTSDLFTDINNFYPSTAHNLAHKVINKNMSVFYQPNLGQDIDYLYVTINELYASKGCYATLTPYVGDKTVHIAEVFCRDSPSPHERKCLKPDLLRFKPLICDGNPNVKNPCSHADAVNGTKYPLPGSNIGYIQCLPNGLPQVIYCPSGYIFDPNCGNCYGSSSAQVDCTQPKLTGVNPCTAQNLLNGHFFFEYHNDKTKYIHCDIWGHPWLQACPSGSQWVQQKLTCEQPTTSYNPCGNMASTGLRFFAYPHNVHYYVECLDSKTPLQRPCPDGNNEGWDDCAKTCVPMHRLTQNCRGDKLGPGTGQTTPAPQTGSNVLSSGYQYPCTQQNLKNYQYYFQYQPNKHQYIQCGVEGTAYLRDCANNDCFDPFSHTCVDGCIFIDNKLG